VYQNYLTPTWKHQIGLTWHIGNMEPITEAHPMDKAPYHKLCLCVLLSN